MGKSFKLITKKIWLIVLGIFISTIILNYFFKVKFFVFEINPNFLVYILFLISIICPIIIFDYSKENMRVWKLIYTILAFLIIAISIFIYMLLFSENKYFTFNSLEKTNVLVVEEKSFLFSEISTFYEKKFGVFIKPLDIEIDTDDGFRPFSNEEYKIKWIDESTVIIKYYYGNSDVWKEEKISFK